MPKQCEFIGRTAEESSTAIACADRAGFFAKPQNDNSGDRVFTQPGKRVGVRFRLFLLLSVFLSPPLLAQSPARGPARFDTAFEGTALGRVEVLGETEFRVHVPGQQDARGRNRHATWYFFRMDNVRGRDLSITLTGFLPGEYNFAHPIRSRATIADDHWRQLAIRQPT